MREQCPQKFAAASACTVATTRCTTHTCGAQLRLGVIPTRPRSVWIASLSRMGASNEQACTETQGGTSTLTTCFALPSFRGLPSRLRCCCPLLLHSERRSSSSPTTGRLVSCLSFLRHITGGGVFSSLPGASSSSTTWGIRATFPTHRCTTTISRIPARRPSGVSWTLDWRTICCMTSTSMYFQRRIGGTRARSMMGSAASC
mmetsp:Transcript_15598/g.35968  ORF Transcript_15598/g.35968 Transcript_15598/m.35968 type:complete len:202 (-) Transcript_15598:1134-1739(-)